MRIQKKEGMLEVKIIQRDINTGDFILSLEQAKISKKFPSQRGIKCDYTNNIPYFGLDSSEFVDLLVFTLFSKQQISLYKK